MNEYDIKFMELAQQVSKKSDDPRKKVGSVIVNPEGGIVSMGFNNIPLGIKNREKILSNKEFKNRCIIHAEEHAIISTNIRAALLGCSIYVYPLPPCERCASLIVYSGIRKVVFLEVDRSSSWYKPGLLAQELMSDAGLKLVKIEQSVVEAFESDAQEILSVAEIQISESERELPV